MVTQSISKLFSFISIVVMSFLIHSTYSLSLSSQSINVSFAGSSSGVATWYGNPLGSGNGGACGFEDDVANAPYYGMIAAGNENLFQHGKGCGNCYQLKCTENPACSGNPITITIADQCPGSCNNEAIHFDLSGKAFGYLAKPGQENLMRNVRRINIQYQRVQCYYRTPITFKITRGSNPYHLAFAIENENGDGDVGYAAILPSSSRNWLVMAQNFGETWDVGLPMGTKGPFSVKITTIESRRTILATNVIPANWLAGESYRAKGNF